ncbi:MAG: RlmE family RNA methyltransferase [Candidatus Thermoplasmatota archaeon]|nr:RlmE family RNA methyltransferase [Candidatus Thermoplasmatota archaeon]
MGRTWREQRKRDHYYKKAKKEGYLARSAYKLKQIDSRYNILSKGDVVVDLGAAPGGWSQVALEKVGMGGMVIGVDLKEIEAEGVIAIRGDMTKDETLAQVREAAGGPVDVVLSDMSPRISGNYSMDHARSVHLSQIALQAALKLLRPGGHFAVKVFQGDLFKGFYDEVGEHFSFHKGQSPKATRKGSSEAYVIGKGFHG